MSVPRVLLAIALAVSLGVGALGSGCTAADTPSNADEEPSSMPEQDGLEVGTEAPELRLKNQEQATVVLSDYEGVSNVILVFYPLAFTPV